MKNTIHASVKQCASSESRLLQDHYLPDSTSWYRYQQDKANNGPILPLPVISKLKSKYVRLSDDSLLTDGKPQNQNEALNSMVRQRTPKKSTSVETLLRWSSMMLLHTSIWTLLLFWSFLMLWAYLKGKFTNAGCQQQYDWHVFTWYRERAKGTQKRNVLRGQWKGNMTKEKRQKVPTMPLDSFRHFKPDIPCWKFCLIIL